MISTPNSLTDPFSDVVRCRDLQGMGPDWQRREVHFLLVDSRIGFRAFEAQSPGDGSGDVWVFGTRRGFRPSGCCVGFRGFGNSIRFAARVSIIGGQGPIIFPEYNAFEWAQGNERTAISSLAKAKDPIIKVTAGVASNKVGAFTIR